MERKVQRRLMPWRAHRLFSSWPLRSVRLPLLFSALITLAVILGHARQGASIAYVETHYGTTSHIYLFDVDRGRDWMVTDAISCQVDWTQDGGSLLLTHTLSGGRHQVMIVSLWRAGARMLTTGGFSNEAPSVSPDGSRIVYAANGGRANTLYLIDLQSGESNPLAVLPLWVNATRWSPDGAHIIAEGVDSSREARVYAVDSASGTIEALNLSANTEVPSPDGQHTALIETEADGEALLIRESGDSVLALVDGFQDIEVVAWSRDGTRIAFSAQAQATGVRQQSYDLYVIKRDGSGLSLIRNGISRFVSTPGSYINSVSHICAIAWSP